jgi:hypothetical protein
MKSLKIENGDIVFNSIGRLDFVEENEFIIQSLNLRFKTLKEELFYNEEYGRPIFTGKYTQENILAFVQDALMDDERIASIEVTDFKINAGRLDINIKLYLATDEVIDLNITE